MTEEYPHLVFLSENRIDIETLPRLLQKRIRGFEELYEDLTHTTAEDRPELVNRLSTLSLEIEEDLEEHYGDSLEPDPEDGADEKTAEEINLHAEEIPVPVQLDPSPDVIFTEQEQLMPPAYQPDTLPESASEIPRTDAELLTALWKEGYRQLLPGTAVAKQLKTVLTERRIFIGGFLLQRRKYSSCYDISLTGE